MDPECTFHLGPHIGYIKRYTPATNSGFIVSFNDGNEYVFSRDSISVKLLHQFSEEMIDIYGHVSGIHEKEYFDNELGLFVVGFLTDPLSASRTAVDIQFPEKYVNEYKKNIYCFYTRIGQKRKVLSVLFEAVPSIKYLINYRKVRDEHLCRYGTEKEVRQYVDSINLEEVILSFKMWYYHYERSYTPMLGEERSWTESGVGISYNCVEFPNHSRKFEDSYLNYLKEKCKEFSSLSINDEINKSDTKIAQEYLREAYSKEEHLNCLLERIPVRFHELRDINYSFVSINGIERNVGIDDLSFCVDDIIANKIKQMIEDFPNMKIKENKEILSFFEGK